MKKGSRQVIDLVGRRFGRLIVLSREPDVTPSRWRCICDCGNETVVKGLTLRDGRTRSCRCYMAESTGERSVIHGESVGRTQSAEYRTLRGMIRRCHDKQDHAFGHYGAKGIRVCDRWRFGEAGLSGIECFIADMGRKPTSAHSIDRWPDGAGGYEPGNCRWATRREQAFNTRRNLKIRLDGRTLNLMEAAALSGISEQVLRLRVKRGWSDERAISQPVRGRL